MARRTDQLLQHVLFPAVTAAAIPGGGAQYKSVANLSNIRTLNVDTIVVDSIQANSITGVAVGGGGGGGGSVTSAASPTYVTAAGCNNYAATTGGTGRVLSNVAGFGTRQLSDVASSNSADLALLGDSAASKAISATAIVAVGSAAGTVLCNVSNSTFVGAFAGANAGGGGSGNVFLGAYAGSDLVNVSNTFVVNNSATVPSSNALLYGVFASVGQQGRLGVNRVPQVALDVSGAVRATSFTGTVATTNLTGTIASSSITGNWTSAVVNSASNSLGGVTLNGNAITATGSSSVGGVTLNGGQLGVANRFTLGSGVGSVTAGLVMYNSAASNTVSMYSESEGGWGGTLYLLNKGRVLINNATSTTITLDGSSGTITTPKGPVLTILAEGTSNVYSNNFISFFDGTLMNIGSVVKLTWAVYNTANNWVATRTETFVRVSASGILTIETAGMAGAASNAGSLSATLGTSNLVYASGVTGLNTNGGKVIWRAIRILDA